MRSDTQPRHRRSIRLPEYDYTQPGGYFVTVCTHERENLFGEVNDDAMVPNRLGKVIAGCWQQLPMHFPEIELDAWVIMPNHLHGIIIIGERPMEGSDARRGEAFAPSTKTSASDDDHCPTPLADVFFSRAIASPLHRNPSPLHRNPSPLHPASSPVPPNGTTSGSLGAIIQNFKSITTRRVNTIRRTPGAPLWQRNYYEHIIRHQQSLDEIREYIAGNPARWTTDLDFRTQS